MDGERVTLTVEKKDLRLLCMGLHRIWGDTNQAIEKTKYMKELARGKAYEDEIDEALAHCRRELTDISNLYARLSSFRG